MFAKLYDKFFKLMIMLLTFFSLSVFILFFNQKQRFDPGFFMDTVPIFFEKFIHLFHYTFRTPSSYIDRQLFPFIIEPWVNTMKILLLSLTLSIALSLLFVLISKRFDRLDRAMKRMIKVLSYLPDIFIMPAAILVIVWIFQQTGILIMEVASSAGTDVVLLPAILLSIVPFVQFYRILDQTIDEQLTQPYVVLARGKGLNQFEVLTRHIFPNILPVFYINFRQVVWMTLSSLLIMEVIFNIFGVTSFLYSYKDPVILFVVFIMMFIPLLILFKLIQLAIERRTGVKL